MTRLPPESVDPMRGELLSAVETYSMRGLDDVVPLTKTLAKKARDLFEHRVALVTSRAVIDDHDSVASLGFISTAGVHRTSILPLRERGVDLDVAGQCECHAA